MLMSCTVIRQSAEVPDVQTLHAHGLALGPGLGIRGLQIPFQASLPACHRVSPQGPAPCGLPSSSCFSDRSSGGLVTELAGWVLWTAPVIVFLRLVLCPSSLFTEFPGWVSWTALVIVFLGRHRVVPAELGALR